MKKWISTLALAAMSLQGFAQNEVTLDASQAKTQINRQIYGHFAEHLGACIYGGLYVGENNTKIPNINGARKDVIEALKKMKIPNLRWPGGCFADTYHWKDGIGLKQRPSIVNAWWGGVTEDNSFGTHDFLNLCKELGTEPYLAGNVGSGTVKELSDWVQYVNHNGVSPMANLRKENGQDKAWGVKFWGVGNEAWGCGGNMKAEYYANIYRQYATFMTDWDNGSKLFRIASGANSKDYNWTEVLMRDIPHHMLEVLLCTIILLLIGTKKAQQPILLKNITSKRCNRLCLWTSLSKSILRLWINTILKRKLLW
jgi:alpha-N-arabinofuranosidase